MHNDCTIERRVFTKTGSLNIVTGEMVMPPDSEGEWRVKACGVPLFDERLKRVGICGSCLNGWEVKDNQPTDKGREQIAAAKELFDA